MPDRNQQKDIRSSTFPNESVASAARKRGRGVRVASVIGFANLLLWTSPATSTPPVTSEAQFGVGDGEYGEVWRREGSADLTLFGTRLAVDDAFFAVASLASGSGTPRVIDVYVRAGADWQFDQRITANPATGFAEAIAIDGLRLAALTSTGVNTYVRGRNGWELEQAVTLPFASGSSLALQGDTLAIGRPLASSSVASSGQVEILSHTTGSWQLSASIPNPTPVAGRRFGTAIAFAGEKLLITAPRETNPTTWSGALYRYAPNSLAWTLEATVLPNGLTVDARFGSSLSSDGTHIAVGAPNDAALGTTTGAVIVLTPVLDGYTQTLLRSAASGAGREFGTSVAIRDDKLVVGSPMGGTSMQRTGIAELFELSPRGAWSPERYLLPAPWTAAFSGANTGIDAMRGIGAACVIDPFDGTCIISAPTSYVDGVISRGVVYAIRKGGPDCNANGVPDLREVLGDQSISLGPIPFSGEVTQTLSIPAEPKPTGPVRVTITARTNGGSATVRLNGISVGTLHTNVFSGCAATWGPTQVVIPHELYGSIVGDGDGELAISHVPGSSCAPLADSFLRVDVRYPTSPEPSDLDTSFTLDTCQDCDADGISDVEAIGAGLVEDCNGNWVPDDCETTSDCDGNGVTDTCDIAAGAPDCNDNGVLDACEIAAGTLNDCNADGTPDLCDIMATTNATELGEIAASLSGVTNALRLQSLRTTPETETLFGISALWRYLSGLPMPPATTPITLIVFSDPNQDGQPNDAVPLSWITLPIGTPGVQQMVHYPIAPQLIGPAGTSFFLGTYIELSSSTLLSLDCDLKASAGSAFYSVSLPTSPTTSLQGATILALPSNFPASTWMIRGLGAEAAECLIGPLADLDHDGSVGPTDLALLLGNWDGQGLGDLDGNGLVGAADLALLLGAWTL
jgi:hypothetical protein